VMRAYSMERLAIPPLVGVWAPIRGRGCDCADCEGTGLPYCDRHRSSTLDLRIYLRINAYNYL